LEASICCFAMSAKAVELPTLNWIARASTSTNSTAATTGAGEAGGSGVPGKIDAVFNSQFNSSTRRNSNAQHPRSADRHRHQ
jgi:hypothetical protein